MIKVTPFLCFWKNLKATKIALRAWRKTKCSTQALCDQIKSEANDWYEQIQKNPLDDHIVSEYPEKNERLSNLIRKLATEKVHRMKIKWLTQSDKTIKIIRNKMSIPKPIIEENVFLILKANYKQHWSTSQIYLVLLALTINFQALFVKRFYLKKQEKTWPNHLAWRDWRFIISNWRQ